MLQERVNRLHCSSFLASAAIFLRISGRIRLEGALVDPFGEVRLLRGAGRALLLVQLERDYSVALLLGPLLLRGRLVHLDLLCLESSVFSCSKLRDEAGSLVVCLDVSGLVAAIGVVLLAAVLVSASLLVSVQLLVENVIELFLNVELRLGIELILLAQSLPLVVIMMFLG